MKKTIILFHILFSSILCYGQGSLGCIIPNKPSGGVLTSGVTCTVDNASTFKIRQTTAGQNITVPNSSSTVIRTIEIFNDSISGSVTFTLSPGGIVPLNRGLRLQWVGNKWVVIGKYLTSSSSLEFTSWNSGTNYVIGNAVIYGGLVWLAVEDNTNAYPGGGDEWILEVVKTDSYSNSWSGSTYAPTQNSVFNAFEVTKDSLWNLYANSFGSRKKFGNSSNYYGWDYVMNDSVIGGVSNTGKFFIGNTSASLNAALTLYSVDEKYLKFRDYADNVDALHIWIEDTTMDAYFQMVNGAKMVFRDASTDILSLKPTTIEFATRPIFFSSGANNGINLGTSTSSYRLSLFVSDGSGGLSNEEAYLNVNNSNLNIRTGSSFSKTWQFDYLGNFGMQGSDYGGGNGVMYMANAAVNINANPTGGFLMQAKSGNPFFWTSSGDTIQLYTEAALTVPVTTLTSDAPGTPDYNYTGSVTNITPYGLSSADELKSLLAIIKNLQDRINELEANLQNIGIQE